MTPPAPSRPEHDAPSPPVVVLEAAGLSKHFDRTPALDGVGLRLGAGEVHAIAGQNGAGKSTLIKVLTGFHKPDAGTLTLGGEVVSFEAPRDAQRAGISAMYQEVNLIPLRSVAHNLFLGEEPTNRLGLIDVRRLNAQASEVMQRYGLGSIDVTADVATFPLGVQQMVALVRAAAASSRVLVMDEPTSALNAAEVETLLGVVRRLKAEGVGILYVSHRLDELYEVCDVVTVLRDGRVVTEASLADLSRRELVDAMLGRRLAEDVAQRRGAPGDEGDTALEVSDLRRPPKVRHVGLRVAAGEVLGLAGLLGAGRTETVETIFGIERAQSGEVTVEGRRLRPGSPAAAIAAGVGFLPEDRRADGIVPNMSIRDNIGLAVMDRMRRLGTVIDRRKLDATVDDLVGRLSIACQGPDQPVGELSGGNQQKVLIARSLATSPRIILLDDPTRGVDVGAKADVHEIIRRLADEGVAVIVISSEVEELVATCDRVVVVANGEVTDELTGEDVTVAEILGRLAAPGGSAAGGGEAA